MKTLDEVDLKKLEFGQYNPFGPMSSSFIEKILQFIVGNPALPSKS